jgi:hypothetical protein
MMTEFKKLGLTFVIGFVLIMIHVLIKELFSDGWALTFVILTLLGAMYWNSITRELPKDGEE